MKYWVFNEDQLRAALDAFALRYKQNNGTSPQTVVLAVEAFLDSEEVRKLRMESNGAQS